jgi:hypothetical protein
MGRFSGTRPVNVTTPRMVAVAAAAGKGSAAGASAGACPPSLPSPACPREESSQAGQRIPRRRAAPDCSTVFRVIVEFSQPSCRGRTAAGGSRHPIERVLYVSDRRVSLF